MISLMPANSGGPNMEKVTRYLEVLEAEDVQDSDELGLVLSGVGAFVDGIHQPGKRPGVQRFGHSVAVVAGLKENHGYTVVCKTVSVKQLQKQTPNS